MDEPVSHLHPVDDLPSNEGDSPKDDEGTASAGSGRLRSTIAFPYNGLSDAELIAETLHQTYGGTATQDQLAGSLGTTPRSGTFRNKMGAARIFGVVSVGQGKVKLTALGDRLVDPKTKRQARVDAFMTVPLYAAIYSEYEGRALPPDEGLERKIADLGVSPKQTAKARQAMNSSAKLAGFFEIDRTRLIRPSDARNSEGLKGRNGSGENGSGEESKSVQKHVAIDPTVPLPELWMRLLNESADWSAEKTQDFVKKAREMRELLARDN